jgi:hypothetical protein
MILNVVPLSAEVYDSLLKDFIKCVEGERLDVYLDPINPTIGWGFALNKGRNPKALDYFLNTVLGVNKPGLDNLSDKAIEREKYWQKQLIQTLGFGSKWKGKSNEDLRNALNKVLADRNADYYSPNYTQRDRDLIGNPAEEFKYYTAYQIELTFDRIKANYDARLNFLGANLPQNCDERIAFFSMAYQGTLERRKSLLQAALSLPNAKDARAEAWYIIRYVNVMHPWRGYMESSLFKLYDNKNNVTAEDARAVYKMFTRHRDNILAFEETNSGQIANANSKRLLGDAVLSIEETLNDAKTALLADLRSQTTNSKLLAKLTDDNFNSVDIYLAKDTAGYMNVPHGTLEDSLMIGNDHGITLHDRDRDDVLIGGAGVDRLISTKGDDLLCGGADNDYYFIWKKGQGDGTVTIEDKQGPRNELIFNGRPVAYFVTGRAPNGDTWKSEVDPSVKTKNSLF